MTQILRQSTQVVVRIGPFVDVTDGFTPETGITLSGADEAEALKAAGAATVSIAGNTWAAISGADGWYDLTLSTTDTGTVGTLDIVVNDDSVCLPVFSRFQVIEEAPYDGLYASSAAGYLQPTTAGRTLDVSAGGEAGVDWANVGSPTTSLALTGTTIATTQKVDVETIKTQAVTAAAGVTFPTSIASPTNITAGTITTVTTLTGHTPQTGDSFARIGAAGAGLTDLGGMSTTMKAQVEAEAVDALAQCKINPTDGVDRIAGKDLQDAGTGGYLIGGA